MQAPKCRLCGKRHYGPCPDLMVVSRLVFAVGTPNPAANSADLAVNKPENCAANTNPESENHAPILDAANTKCQSPTGETPGYIAKARYKDVDRRREYMRNFMRRKRAEKKAVNRDK